MEVSDDYIMLLLLLHYDCSTILRLTFTMIIVTLLFILPVKQYIITIFYRMAIFVCCIIIWLFPYVALFGIIFKYLVVLFYSYIVILLCYYIIV